YKLARQEFMLGHLDDTFYEKCILGLRTAIEMFDRKASAKEKGQYKLTRLRAESFLVDGLYWIGRNREAEEIVLTLRNFVQEMTDMAKSLGDRSVIAMLAQLSTDERRQIREKIRTAINYALLLHYHRHDYKSAEDILSKCLRLIEAVQDENELPCFG